MIIPLPLFKEISCPGTYPSLKTSLISPFFSLICPSGPNQGPLCFSSHHLLPTSPSPHYIYTLASNHSKHVSVPENPRFSLLSAVPSFFYAFLESCYSFQISLCHLLAEGPTFQELGHPYLVMWASSSTIKVITLYHHYPSTQYLRLIQHLLKRHFGHLAKFTDRMRCSVEIGLIKYTHLPPNDTGKSLICVLVSDTYVFIKICLTF